ncbi:ribosomal protein S18 [Aspergillus crustosus]
MSSNLFSLSPLRVFATAARPACRFNSTNAHSGTNSALHRIERLQSPNQKRKGAAVPQKSFVANARAHMESRAISRFQTREWRTGDVYAPHDLSPAEMKKWQKRNHPTSDIFDARGINPLHLYKNYTVMSQYMTPMGRIKHSKFTGLRGVNQRKLAKALRRAIGIGMMPSVHRHPEIIASSKYGEASEF